MNNSQLRHLAHQKGFETKTIGGVLRFIKEGKAELFTHENVQWLLAYEPAPEQPQDLRDLPVEERDAKLLGMMEKSDETA